MKIQDLTSTPALLATFPLTRVAGSAVRIASLTSLLIVVSASAVVIKEATHRSQLQPLAKLDAPLVVSQPAAIEPDTAGLPVAKPTSAADVHDPLMMPEMTVEPQAETAVETPARTDLVDDVTIRYFNGRPVRPVRTIRMNVSAYSPDARSCDDSADNITSSNHDVYTNAMKMVAADSRVLPLGSLVSVPGYDSNNVVPVLDRGGAIKGNKLDVLYPTHEVALRWGRRMLEVTVWEYADGLPADDYRKIRDSKE